MTEGLFVLTVIFVAYVFYVIANDKKTPIKSTSPAVETEKQAMSVASSSPDPVPDQVLSETPKTEAPTTTVESTADEESVSAKQGTHKKGVKNPKTGEIVTIHSNYIFTKRWIKEALVAEGLLEKIYKNNELNTEVEAAIKVAIAKLEEMEQYKV